MNENDAIYLSKRALRGTTSSAMKADEMFAIKRRWKSLRQKDELEQLFG